MKIVIEIGNEHYERIMRLEEDVTVYPTTLALYEAVKNATPLPEHHGRLIDADRVIAEMNEMKVGGEVFTTAVNYVKLTMKDAPTIVEADKEGKADED